jgi:hypothetical protein
MEESVKESYTTKLALMRAIVSCWRGLLAGCLLVSYRPLALASALPALGGFSGARSKGATLVSTVTEIYPLVL